MHNLVAIVHLLGSILLSVWMGLSPEQFTVLFVFSSIMCVVYAECFYQWKKNK